MILDKVSLDYSAVLIGGQCAGRVSLKVPFSAADLTITLACDQPFLATLNTTTVTIPKGAVVSNDFIVSSTGVVPASPSFKVTILATLASAMVSTMLEFDPPAIAQFTLSPSTVNAGQSTTGTIVLATTCPADLSISLLSYSSFATIPVTPVTIQKNTLQIQFTIDTPTSSISFANMQVPILASCGKVNATAILIVQPTVVAGIVKSITLFPASVRPGGTTTATVTLQNAVNVATNVGLTSFALNSTVFSGPSPLIAQMPSHLPMGPGQAHGQFTITVQNISAGVTQRTAVIMAVAGGGQAFAHLVVTT